MISVKEEESHTSEISSWVTQVLESRVSAIPRWMGSDLAAAVAQADSTPAIKSKMSCGVSRGTDERLIDVSDGMWVGDARKVKICGGGRSHPERSMWPRTDDCVNNDDEEDRELASASPSTSFTLMYPRSRWVRLGDEAMACPIAVHPSCRVCGGEKENAVIRRERKDSEERSDVSGGSKDRLTSPGWERNPTSRWVRDGRLSGVSAAMMDWRTPPPPSSSSSPSARSTVKGGVEETVAWWREIAARLGVADERDERNAMWNRANDRSSVESEGSEGRREVKADRSVDARQREERVGGSEVKVARVRNDETPASDSDVRKGKAPTNA